MKVDLEMLYNFDCQIPENYNFQDLFRKYNFGKNFINNRHVTKFHENLPEKENKHFRSFHNEKCDLFC